MYSDLDPDIGFVLLPDLKWDQGELENLYMLAVVRKRGLLSLRELNAAHLPLLKNVLHKGKVWVVALYSGTPLNSHPRIKANCNITARHPGQ